MSPTNLLKALLAVYVSALFFSPVAQASGGGAVGWGYDFYGQAGNGAPVTTGCFCIATPTAVSGVAGATQTSASRYHTLSLLSDGSVRAWGLNHYGELGNGATADSPSPVAVGGLANVVAVAAGDNHSLALLSNGAVVVWGRNSNGQLGLGTSSGPESCEGNPCSRAPVAVPGLSDVIAIAASNGYSLALLSNGSVLGWGQDHYGQLGDGVGVQSGCECVDHPTPVPGLSGAMAISAGTFEASALLSDGTVKDWGRNVTGGLGNGAVTTATPCQCLPPVAVNGLAGVKAVSAGGLHGMALLVGGGVQAWGYNTEGQLGNGATSSGGCECIPTPVSVSGTSGIQQIAAGGYHSLALLPDGSAQSWGRNDEGQLGTGDTGDRAAPGPVSGLSGASAVTASELGSFALVGPSQALTVSLAGAAAGTVGGPTGIVCPLSCAARFPQGQVETLRAEPAPGSAFAGFSGACAGTGTCQLRMDGDQSVTATFGPPKGTAITAVKVNNRKRTAELSFSAPGAITGYECKLNRPKPKKPKPKGGRGKGHGQKAGRLARRKTGVHVHKQPTPVFVACSAPTTYKNLRPGNYTFQVRALDILGADANPASAKFKIKAPKRKHKHPHKPRS